MNRAKITTIFAWETRFADFIAKQSRPAIGVVGPAALPRLEDCYRFLGSVRLLAFSNFKLGEQSYKRQRFQAAVPLAAFVGLSEPYVYSVEAHSSQLRARAAAAAKSLILQGCPKTPRGRPRGPRRGRRATHMHA